MPKAARFFLLLGCLGFAAPALMARDFQICSNYSEQNLYVAYGYQSKNAWVAKGWFMVRPGRCLPFAAPIEGGNFYYFAYNEDKSNRYDGEHPFCVDSKPFATSTRNPQGTDCAAQGLILRKFKSFELEQASETRLFLEPPSGAQVQAVPYGEAKEKQLTDWADQGDANARAELQRRGRPEARPKPAAPNKDQVDDLGEGPETPPTDQGAFQTR
ncbi:MAG: DUF1036 domain-containing protein [bacterium]|nr:DUF1036 domain-containing protein [bacterium]